MSITQTETPVEMPGEFQSDFDDAKALLNAGRYAAARTALARLLENAPEPLRRDIGYYLEMAAEKLARQIDELVTNAEEYSQRQPDDLVNQRCLWEKILEIKPDYEIAVQALATLTRQEQENKIRLELEQLQRKADNAVANSRLTELNRLLGRAQNLQDTNNWEQLRAELDETVARITSQRQQARERLGRASTLAVTGNLQEAYRQAQEYMASGVITVIDAAGLYGHAGQEVDAFDFYQRVRQQFIGSLRDLAVQHLSLVEGQKRLNPGLALKTLEDILQRLQDKILSSADQDELWPTTTLVMAEVEVLQEHLKSFPAAQKMVLEAQDLRRSPQDQHQLLLEARQLYPDLPHIDDYINVAQQAVIANVLSRLTEITTRVSAFIKRVISNGYYTSLNESSEYLRSEYLSKELEDAGQEVKHFYYRFEIESQSPPLTDVLEQRDELKRLAEEINHLHRELSETIQREEYIRDVLNYLGSSFAQYKETKSPQVLAQARLRLNFLDRIYDKNPEVQRYRTLIDHIQEQLWLEEAQSVLYSAQPDYEKAIALLRLIPQLETSNQGLLLWLGAIRGYIEQCLTKSKESIERFNFREAQSILEQAQKQIQNWSTTVPIALGIGELDSLLQEATDYREAQRDLGEANDIIQRNNRNENNDNVDDLLQKALKLSYRSPVAASLKRDAEWLRAYQPLSNADYGAYKRRILGMMMMYPQDSEIALRYEKMQDFENKQIQLEQKREQNRQWTERRLRWANVWFIVSVLTALVFLGLSFYSIYISVSRNNALAALSSLLSLLPILAAKLVYDRFSEVYRDATLGDIGQQGDLPDTTNSLAD